MTGKWVPLHVAAFTLILASVVWAALALAAPNFQLDVRPAAAALTVTKTADTNDGVCDADCSLREAITTASTGSRVAIPSGTYTLTLGSELVINKDLTLAGSGAESTIIQAGTGASVADFRVFNITSGSVVISGVTIRHGKTSGSGGGILNAGTLTLANSTVSDNTAGFGGGIVNSGTLTITSSTVNSNTAGSSGGGISNGIATLTVTNTTLTLLNSTVSGNTATNGSGGGIWNTGTLTVTSSTVSNNTAGGAGSGIYNFGRVTMTSSTVSNNTAGGAGSGIFNFGRVTMTSSTVSGNTTDSGIFGGGGIWNNSTMALADSTVSGNSALGAGGGIYNSDVPISTLTLTNSTVSSNSASRGGGIENGGILTMTNSTISSNKATAGRHGGYGGGITPIYYPTIPAAKLANTIIAGNSAFWFGPDCAGSLTSLGHNLIGNNSGCSFTTATGDLVNVDPKLGPLADNGGPTFTHALLPGSPAIDTGNPDVPGSGGNACQAHDQRGIARPLDGDGDGIFRCDMGALEVPALWVNSSNDVSDGTCNATHCSLREAIIAANASTGSDTIAFTIPGTGVHTIQPTSALPTITDPVIIDGYTQPGARPNTNGPGLGSNAVLRIELNGTTAGTGSDVNGLKITSGNSTIRGLVINRFGGSGIRIETAGGNSIEGNLIGTDVSGSASRRNVAGGIVITGIGLPSNNTVGGTAPAARNVIADGMLIVTNANVVQGNLIGTNASGNVGLFSSDSGINIKGGSSNILGGATATARNVISGNNGDGVWIFGPGTGNLVQGNYIGTDVTGTFRVPNNGHGVHLGIPSGAGPSSDNNTIGGTATGAPNILAFNEGDGVFVEGGTGNAIVSNSIFSNSGLGVDLAPDGVTSNDTGDGDSGPNNLQNFPTLTSAVRDTGGTAIQGVLNSAANTTFRLEFFSNAVCDPSGHGEGQIFLGATTVATNTSGNASLNVTIPTTVPVGQFITATAADPNNNTSEFSQCQVVARPGDANRDGRVDVADLRFIAAALGTSDGADLNGDGVVDIRDLALVGINFGRGGP